jgi:hypothetical protein
MHRDGIILDTYLSFRMRRLATEEVVYRVAVRVPMFDVFR